MNKLRVVIFIFTDGQKILVEKRFLQSLKEECYLIPGGRVKKNIEDLEGALRRELMEELGVKPISFSSIPTQEEILGLNGQVLIPFLIHRWEGELPKKILDRGTPLFWLPIEEVLNTSFKPTRKIANALVKALKTYFKKQNDTDKTKII